MAQRRTLALLLTPSPARAVRGRKNGGRRDAPWHNHQPVPGLTFCWQSESEKYLPAGRTHHFVGAILRECRRQLIYRRE